MLLLRAKAHDVFHTGPVVPTAVENQYFALGRKMLDVALQIHLVLFTVGRRRQRHDAENARADPFGQRLIVPPLPAASRPSKMMMARNPLDFTNS